MLTKENLTLIKSLARDKYVGLKYRSRLVGDCKDLDSSELRTVAIYEAILNFLNKEGCNIPENFFPVFVDRVIKEIV